MTVPGAVESIRELSPTLPDGFVCSAPGRCSTPRRRAPSSTPARRSSSARVFAPDVIRACHERDVAAMPGCFSPTEILDAHDAGADIVKVFPATMLGPAVHQGRARAAAAGQADADRRRDARQRRRLDSRRRRRGRRRLGARRRARRSNAATSTAITANRARDRRQRGVARRREDTLMHVVTFGEIMLRLSPPGFERLLQSPSALRDVRRRRSERRRQPRPLRLRQPLRHPPARARHWRRGRPRAARRRRATRHSWSAAASRVGIYFAETGASQRPQRSSTIARDRRSARWRLTPCAGTTSMAGAAWFHVTGITPALGERAAAAARARPSRPRSAPARASASI